MKYFSMLLLTFSLSATASIAKVQVEIDLSAHRLTAATPEGVFVAAIDTGRIRSKSPKGCSNPLFLSPNYISNNRFKPTLYRYSIWLKGNYPIYGTQEVVRGESNTGGSLRLAMKDAASLYQLVKKYGINETFICVH